MTPFDLVVSKVDDPKQLPSGWAARCPVHGDEHASLSLNEGDDGRVLLYCHRGCAPDQIVDALGLKMRDLFPPRPAEPASAPIVIPIKDVDGKVQAVHVRRDRPDGKVVWWMRPDGSKGLGGRPVETLPLWGSERIPAWDKTRPIVVTEGEKAASALLRSGVRAVGTVTGADATGKAPSADVLGVLAGHDVILWPDADDVGRRHMHVIAERLAGIAASVRVIEWPDAAKGDDAFDAVARGVDLDKLLASGKDAWSGTSSTRPLAELLGETVAFIRRYVVFAYAEQADAVALWVGHTWFYDQFDTTPYLAIQSPEKRSGKSRLLECVRLFTHQPVPMAGASLAALFRIIDERHPTLLLDEADTIFNKRGDAATEDLRGLLNNGYRRGVPFFRVVGEGKKMRVESFDVFCPKAIASIKSLPDTVQDRSIVIALQRRARHESVERFRFRRAEQAAVPVREGWEALAATVELPDQADVPDELDDRAADSWEPLLALADAAGGDWPERARHVAKVLSGAAEVDEEKTPIQLLGDIRDIFTKRAVERLAMRDLLDDLHSDAYQEHPWQEWGNGRGIKATGIGRLLVPFGIKVRSIRIAGEVTKGYEQTDFAEAFDRYLPPLAKPPSEPLHRHAEGETERASNGVSVQTHLQNGAANGTAPDELLAQVLTVTGGELLPEKIDQGDAA